MKLNKWKVRESLSYRIFISLIALTAMITFISKDNLELDGIKYVAVGLSAASLLVLIFTNAMNMVETKDYTAKRFFNLGINIIFFENLAYVFWFKLQ
ncbi:MAG: hypothetical protein Q4D95_00400 [Peptoniphilus sp.]|nr:hypothetical protein [Peptoniphilus sp.]